MKKIIKGIAIVSALLMAMTAFTACGNNSSSKSEESGSSVSSQAKDESSKEESKDEKTSKTDTGSATKLVDEDGLEIADDPAINVNDSTAEALLNKAIESKNLSSISTQIVNSSEGNITDASIFAKGNAMVIEMKLSSTVSKSDKAELSPFLDTLSSRIKPAELKETTGISLVCVVAAVDYDGSLLDSRVYS